jgi:plasmid stabilization system protein ParE
MSLPLVFEPEVEAEVDEAYRWYERQRQGLGEDFLAAVQATLDRVQINPELPAIIYRDVRRALVRRFPYAVYYRVEPERIAVVAIHHVKRDPRRRQSRA